MCYNISNKGGLFYMETIGKRIARLRKEKNITQKALAEKIGVSDKAVSKWEQGGSPDIDLLPSIAKFFDVSIDYLVTGHQQIEPQKNNDENILANLEADAKERYEQILPVLLKDGLVCIDALLNETNYLLIERVLTKNSIHYYELVNKLLKEENFKELYYLAVDKNWKEIITDIANNNYDKILKTAHNCLVAKRCCSNTYSGTIYENSHYFRSNDITDHIIEKIKSEIILQAKTDFENKSILRTLTKEYFYSLLSHNDTDKLIIQLYRRFEAVLRGTFHYEGDYGAMLQKYCALECSAEMAELLNRHRIMRNGLVHSEKTSDSMTQNEIVKCIEHICAIN